MDRGRIEGERDGQRMTAPVAELELELKDGRPEDLIAAGLRLTGRGATSLALVPMVRGKAERGYLLVSGTPAPPTKASARGFVAALRPDMDSGAALRAIIAHGLDVLLANTEALRDVHAPEYVHQARVALRRMRSAVRLLDRKHKDFPETLAAELRWAARLLGAARDWDVMVSMTLPGLLAQAPRAERHLARTLLARAQRQRLKERREVVRAITSARFARLALRLHSWTLTPSPRGRRLVRLAPRLLGRAHRRLFDAARAFAGQSPERRHRVRILAKRLRYALDVMAVALPEEPTRRYVASLAELQDVLGELNDLAVARGSIEGLAAGQRARDVVQATLHEREAELLLDAETRLTQLRTRPRAWDVDAA
jgi:CHAD domain-containing protein